MNRHPITRMLLLILHAFVAVTALAGGSVLVASAMTQWETFFVPPLADLEGSPFDSYLLPGLALGGVLGGVHVLAFVLLVRRSAWAALAAVVAGYAALIWIFVQMMFIPFNFLQAVYLAAGLAEVGLVLLVLGVFKADRLPRPVIMPGSAYGSPSHQSHPRSPRTADSM